jgi:phosphate transport system permease protein
MLDPGQSNDPNDPMRDEHLFEEIRLEKSLRHLRTFVSTSLTGLTFALTLLALFPLFSVLYMLITKGGSMLSWELFTELPPGVGEEGGGIANAIVGTLVMVGLAALIAFPLGILAAIFLAEFGKESKISAYVRFAAKVLTGMPSIIAGVFAYVVVVGWLNIGFSAIAGGVALSLLMIPVVMLTAEESLKLVPAKMREAAYGMGCTRSQVVLKVVVPTAAPGILTGCMLSVARAAGETAPLLFTARMSSFMFSGDLQEPTASLAMLIYNFSGVPFENQINMAWAASLVLVLMVLIINVLAQILTRSPHRER